MACLPFSFAGSDKMPVGWNLRHFKALFLIRRPIRTNYARSPYRSVNRFNVAQFIRNTNIMNDLSYKLYSDTINAISLIKL